jgi:hypothetical protein
VAKRGTGKTVSDKKSEQVTYLPGLEDPPMVEWAGRTFHAFVPKTVTNADLIERARGNRFFRVGAIDPRGALLGEPLRKTYQSLKEIVRLPSSVALDQIKELRWRQVNALMCMADFLKRTSAGNDVANIFADLAVALNELDVGIVHPMLEVSKKIGPLGSPIGGRSNDRSDVWMLRVLAANGVECFIRSGCSRAKAAGQVANEFPELKKLLRPSSGSPSNKRRPISLENSLLSWYDAAARGTLVDPVATSSAREFREHIEAIAAQLSSEQMVAFGKNLLRSASDQAAKLLFPLTNLTAAAKNRSKEGVLLRRLPPSQTKALDKWIARQKDELTRPEAIRCIIEQALATV